MTTAATQAKLWYAMRLSSMVLAVCVLIHIITVIYAVRGGLSATEILGRTHGNWFFAGFYGVFVVACAVHVPIGLGAVASEWLGLRERMALIAAQIVGLVILVMGLRAVYGVVAG
jgi:fumarate reductase subunit C